MNGHTVFLRLVATSLDFALVEHEARSLASHLDGCAACRRAADALRSDAAALRSLPRHSPSPQLAARIMRVARGESRTGRSPFLLLGLGFLLVAGLGGAVIGGAIVREALEADSITVPSPAPSDAAVAVPSPTATSRAAEAAGEIVFEADVGGTPSIFRLDVGSGEVTRLTDGDSPDWSPDGSRIAFSREDQGDLQVWVMDRDASGLRTLGQGLGPVWSPDGSRIAFSRSPIDEGDLLVMDADGSGVTPLAGGSDFAWSPDGARIATVTGSSQPDLMVVDADSSGSTRLAAGQYPAWSPDGTRIAFVPWDEPVRLIQVIDVESGDRSTIAQEISDPYGPVWSPDGTRIAFISVGGDLWVAPAGGGQPVRLTNGLQTAYAPAWSPDGAWIAFTVQTVGADFVSSDIWLVRADGANARPLTTTGTALRPAWRPVSPSEPPIVDPSATTPDPRLGVEWQVVAPDGLGLAQAVTVGEPGFVAVGRPADGGCEGAPDQCWGGAWISSDGVTWQEAPRQASLEIGAYFPLSGPGSDMIGVAAGPDTIVAIGYAMAGAPTIDAGGELRPAVWTSTDGLQWERVADESIFERARFSDVAATDEGFVIVGAVYGVEQPLQGEPRGAIWTSVDAHEWQRVPDGLIFDIGGYEDTGEEPGSGGPRRVTAAAGGIIAVGTACDDTGLECVTAFWSSPDGSTWERVVLEEPNVNATDIAATASGFVAVGTVSFTGGCGLDLPCTAAVFNSTDGRIWQRQQVEVPEGMIAPDSFSDVVVVGGRIIAISNELEPDGLAQSQAPAADALWSSTDGRLWTPLEGVAVDFDPDAYWQPIASGPDRVAIIGNVRFDPEEVQVLISPPR